MDHLPAIGDYVRFTKAAHDILKELSTDSLIVVRAGRPNGDCVELRTVGGEKAMLTRTRQSAHYTWLEPVSYFVVAAQKAVKKRKKSEVRHAKI